MQQTWNLSQTLHGHIFLEKSFTPNYIVNYDFLCQEYHIFDPYVTLIYFFTHLYTYVFKFLLYWTTKYDKKESLKALFYPRKVKFYTDNVRASVTNYMSACAVYSALILNAVQCRFQFSIIPCSLELSVIHLQPSRQKLHQAESRPTM